MEGREDAGRGIEFARITVLGTTPRVNDGDRGATAMGLTSDLSHLIQARRENAI